MSRRVHLESPISGRPGIAAIRLDDGRANAMQGEWLFEFNEALDEVESASEIHSLVLHGREDFFSGGLDLKVLPDLTPDALQAVTGQFAKTMRRVFLFPKPVVAAASGHAIAGGMMLFLAADIRLAQRGSTARFGLNEAVTGIPLLGGTAGLSQATIPREFHTEMILHGRLVGAEGLFERRIVHELVDEPAPLLDRAIERALELSDVDLPAYAMNKWLVRGPTWDAAVEASALLSEAAPSENLFARIRR